MLTNMSMTVTCQCLMSIPKNALGQDVPTTYMQMPTTFEHTKILPTTFDKTPLTFDTRGFFSIAWEFLRMAP